MNLCSENHDEVCYETRDCPACVKVEEIEVLEATISALREEIKTLKDKAT